MGPNTLIALYLASAVQLIVEQSMVTTEDVPKETLNAMSERLQNRINTFQAKLDAAP